MSFITFDYRKKSCITCEMKYFKDRFERYTIIRQKNFTFSNNSMRTETLLYVEL